MPDRTPGAALPAPLTLEASRRRLAQAVRRGYDAEVARRYVLAETATRGHVLSEEGEARGVDPRNLFSGPAWRVDRFGSEELREWFAEHGRITLAEWRAMTSTDRQHMTR